MPSQTHYFQSDLVGSDGKQIGIGSKVSFRIGPPCGAIIFVHGYRGNATSTWGEFSLLHKKDSCQHLPKLKRFLEYDHYYFGYDYVGQAQTAADALLPLLESIGGRPRQQLVKPSLREAATQWPRNHTYDHIVLCCHSAGALVARLALLKAYRREPLPQWLDRVVLIFFAPAHMGANIIPLASLFFGAIQFSMGVVSIQFGKALEATLKYHSPMLNDLDPKSKTLSDLLAATQVLVKKQEQEKTKKIPDATVNHSSRDRVVIATTFLNDNHETPINVPNGRDRWLTGGHTQVCKPSPSFCEPIERLLKVLP